MLEIPKKKFSQNFLKDTNLAKKIARLIAGFSEQFDLLIEVGPGTGLLTVHLVELIKQKEIHLIEIDGELTDKLTSDFPNVNVHCTDFLKLNLESIITDGRQAMIVGNFPYHISSPILFKINDHRQLFTAFTGMFQKEFAERVCAKPGSKAYGIPSVIIQAYYDVKKVLNVNRNVFYPVPEVDSAVISGIRKQISIPDCDDELFVNLVRMAFGKRRKTLRNSLKPLIQHKVSAELPFMSERPEDLSIDDFIHLCRKINAK